jgi:hypothetical protein
MTQPLEQLWLVVGRPLSADAVKWVADLVAENARLTSQLAEREGIARELAETINPFACACISVGKCGEGHRWGYTVNNCAKAQAARVLARFHAAEGDNDVA